MKVKKNDTVLVLTGKDAGKTAKVLVAIPRVARLLLTVLTFKRSTRRQELHKKLVRYKTNQVLSTLQT